MAELAQSTSVVRCFKMVASSDHLSLKTSAAPVVNISKAGGAFAAAAGTVTEISAGWYKCALTTADTNTLGDLAFYITGTGADDTDFVDQVVKWDKGIASIPNVAAAAAGGLVTGDANNAAKVQSGTGANQVSLSSGAVTVGTNNDKTGYSLSAAVDLTTGAIQALWDKATSALSVAGSIGKRLVDNLDAAVSSRSTVTTAQVRAQVVDVLTVDQITELAQGVPPATPTVVQALALLYLATRNNTTADASFVKLRNDAGTVIAKAAVSDDGTQFSRGKLQSGP